MQLAAWTASLEHRGRVGDSAASTGALDRHGTSWSAGLTCFATQNTGIKTLKLQYIHILLML